MNPNCQTQRVKVTVNDESSNAKRIFNEIENSLLGIVVDEVESEFSKIYKCQYTVDLERIIDSALVGNTEKGIHYWTGVIV
jgi:hypothetical protein